MPTSMLSAKEVTTDLLIRYGFQLLGAVVVLVAGALLARWVGNATGNWLETRRMEPPVRTLIVRVVRVVVMVFTLVVALDKFGFQIAPLVAGIGVAGLGIGIALQGVLSNVVAGLSIISNFLFLPVYPLWSLVVITLDVLVIWALTAHGRELRVD